MTTKPTNIGEDSASGLPSRQPAMLSPEALRWLCDHDWLDCDSTATVEPARTVVGQDAAVEALRFGLECYAPGQNVFVRGLTGTGRMTLVQQLLEEIRPACPQGQDRVIVYNFDQPIRPCVITLPRGQARAFARCFEELIRFIEDDLPKTLASEAVQKRIAAIGESARRRAKKFFQPLEKKLKKADLALVVVQLPNAVQTAIYPLYEGRPVSPEEFEQFRQDGKVSEEQFQTAGNAVEKFQPQLREIDDEVRSLQSESREESRTLIVSTARQMLNARTGEIKPRFPQDDIARFLDAIVTDVVENRLDSLADDTSFVWLYRINVLIAREEDATCPIVIENAPSMTALLGSIDRRPSPDGTSWSDHLMICAGALLEADGGYLLLDARELLREQGAWKALMRTLRTGRLEIVPSDAQTPWVGSSLKPEPIDIDLKVILLGDSEVYYLLDGLDPDFPQLFKVLADFDSVIPRDREGVRHYAEVIAKIAREDNLPPFDRGALAALAEHGARIAARSGKLTARFSRLADIAREAAFLAGKDGRSTVIAEDIERTVRRTKQRADLPSRRFREMLADGTIRVETRGRVVGQINALAVIHAGPLVYGFPNRVTATIGPGTAGVINIEREANLSGAIHTKGFYILGGLLRSLLGADHPLAFDASIAFEQSYGGIDGDSASGAEICCLLSALTGIPLRQDFAITGAIDQHGHILAVGAVNEKIEGFFDTCQDVGLTGTQGVIIPESNAGDLMLRHDVVTAAREGQFAVYPVSTVQEALALLTGELVGERDEQGRYPSGSLLRQVVAKAHEYWRKAVRPLVAAEPPKRSELTDSGGKTSSGD